jgi:hypothetical protein
LSHGRGDQQRAAQVRPPRPTKYSPELVARICSHVTHGAPLEVAAQAEGVSAASLQRWQYRYPAVRAQIERARALRVTTPIPRIGVT